MAGDRHRSRDFGTDPDFPYRDEDDRHPGDDYRHRPQAGRDPRREDPHRGRDRWSEEERPGAGGRSHGAPRGGYGQDPDYAHRGGHPVRGGRGRRDDRDDGRNQDRGMLDRAADEVSSWFGDDEATRRREEDHRGKGPRGYRRSDQRIEEDCNDRLTDDPFVDARDIQVSVSNGEITLSGEVDSKRAKRHAEDCADSVSGVTHVQNNLRIRQPDQTAGQTPTSAGSPSSTPSSGGNTI
ncbi:BON domain-containing protein [Fodinicurvata sp. EGI_FJ10296]|uniref:BON domain-containing protein n=1 Tax=Fodinicurvata sp. EGI_FJ10296 TaxID=3231908 RepID=UPI003454EF89